MIKKDENLEEIINADGSLIGSDKYPKNGSNMETKARNTTDHNTGISHQPFKSDMLGLFGFTLLPFFEGEEDISQHEVIKDLSKFLRKKKTEMLLTYIKKPNKLKYDYSKVKEDKNFCDEMAINILEVLKPHLKTALVELKNLIKENIDENSFREGRVLDKKDEPKDITKKGEDKDVLVKKIKKIADLINKMDKKDINKLKNLLEDE